MGQVKQLLDDHDWLFLIKKLFNYSSLMNNKQQLAI